MNQDKPQSNHLVTRRSLTRALLNSLSGLWFALKNERTFRIQLFLALLAVAGGWFFQISSFEWLAVMLAIGWVLSLELFNTQLEKLIDQVHPEYHPKIGRIKDMAAGAVLISALIALIIAGIIFLPKVF